MRILFVTSNRIGDAVLSTGLLDHLIRAHPEARITVACGPDAAGLFVHMPGLERLIPFEKRRRFLHWPLLWAQVVGTRWDLVVDIRGSALSWLVLTRARVVMRRSGGHKTAQLARMLRVSPVPLPVAWTGAAERARAAALLPDGEPWVVLGPTANWGGKMWPAARFVALFEALAARLPGARAAVLAGPGDAEAAMALPVLQGLPGALDLRGRLTLAEAAACFERAALFVGNDSGLMHLAAAAGAPTLGLFGPTPSAEYGPAGRRAAFVESADHTMAALSVEAALAAALGVMGV